MNTTNATSTDTSAPVSDVKFVSRAQAVFAMEVYVDDLDEQHVHLQTVTADERASLATSIRNLDYEKREIEQRIEGIQMQVDALGEALIQTSLDPPQFREPHPDEVALARQPLEADKNSKNQEVERIALSITETKQKIENILGPLHAKRLEARKELCVLLEGLSEDGQKELEKFRFNKLRTRYIVLHHDWIEILMADENYRRTFPGTREASRDDCAKFLNELDNMKTDSKKETRISRLNSSIQNLRDELKRK